jgi:predicted metal-dependent hydrolase
VTVRAPIRASLKTIENFVNSRSEWVVKHLENYNNHTRLNGQIADGEKLLFRGKEYLLRVINGEKAQVLMSDNKIIVTAPVEKNPLSAEKAMKKWYYEQAEILIRENFERIFVRYESFGFKPSVITIRSMKRRWGSCSSKGRITINSELVKIDDIYTEYVILHELCHLKQHNHGPEYYKLLSTVFPEWKNVRKELRKYLS